MSVDFLSKNFPPFQVHHAKKPPRFYPDGFQRNVIDFYFIFSDCRLRKALYLQFSYFIWPLSAPTQEKFSMVVDDVIKSASTASIDGLKEELSAMNEMLLSVSGDTDQTAFWIFSFMAVNPSMEFLSGILQSFAVGKEFKLYSQYFADSTASTRTKQKYHDFCDLFGFDFNETAVNSFRSALSETYKQYSIHEAMQEHNHLMNEDDFLSKWTQIVKDYCGLLSNHFSDKPTNVTSNPTVLVNRYEFCFELSRKENERLKNTIEASVLAFVCRVIQSHLKIENVKFGEPLSPIINVLNDSASNPVDTVIGSRNCFSNRFHGAE